MSKRAANGLARRPARLKAWALLLVLPCIWDSDTLDDELRGLPEAFDLVVGKWHRHGDAYYRQRIDTLAGRSDLTFGQQDDLAVAYERLGDRKRAIEVMHDKGRLLERQDDAEHRYRYLANLGTFLVHSGDLEAGLVPLREAVARNPDAHFGRERFQIELIEYVMAARRDPGLWAKGFLPFAGYRAASMFYRSSGDRQLEWEQAYRGIAGMLRYGGIEGAVLYRTLGDLFLWQSHLHLAWWSYQRAIERGHPSPDTLRHEIERIESHWRDANQLNSKKTPIPTQQEYVARRAAADRWLATFQRLEAEALHRGEDVRSDAALRRLLEATAAAQPSSADQGHGQKSPSSVTFIVIGALVLMGLVMLDRRRRAMLAAAE
jgi:tetratricopeptide (TPR) repeat protein